MDSEFQSLLENFRKHFPLEPVPDVSYFIGNPDAEYGYDIVSGKTWLELLEFKGEISECVFYLWPEHFLYYFPALLWLTREYNDLPWNYDMFSHLLASHAKELKQIVTTDQKDLIEYGIAYRIYCNKADNSYLLADLIKENGKAIAAWYADEQ